MGATAGTNRLTWDDLLAFGEDGVRREIIGGELFVSPAATWPHQRVVTRLGALLLSWADEHGGEVAAGPNNYYTHTDVVEPDVVLAGPERLHQIEGLRFMGAPDLVVEVSSPSTRRWDLVRKRALYEAHAVPEYWFVDLPAEAIDAYRLRDGRYGEPLRHGLGQAVEPPHLPGMKITVNDVLRPA